MSDILWVEIGVGSKSMVIDGDDAADQSGAVAEVYGVEDPDWMRLPNWLPKFYTPGEERRVRSVRMGACGCGRGHGAKIYDLGEGRPGTMLEVHRCLTQGEWLVAERPIHRRAR